MKDGERDSEELIQELESQRLRLATLEASIASERLKSEGTSRALFEQTGDGMFVTSKDGQVVAANEAALDMFGFTKEEAVGSDVGHRFADPGDRVIFNERLGKGSIQGFEVELLKKDGSNLKVLLSGIRLLDDDGNIVGVQGTIHDMRDRRQAPDPSGNQPKSVHNNAGPSVAQSQQLPEHSAPPSRPIRIDGAASLTSQVRVKVLGNLSSGRALVGNVKLIIQPTATPIAILGLHHFLQESAHADVGKFSGTLGKPMLLDINFKKPLSLDRFIGFPLISNVREENYGVTDELPKSGTRFGGVASGDTKSKTPRRFRLTLKS